LDLSADGPKRWRGTIFDVPVGVPLRVKVSDIRGCCFGACDTLALRDLFANDVLLTSVVEREARTGAAASATPLAGTTELPGPRPGSGRGAARLP
jgi:hypothetical protein